MKQVSTELKSSATEKKSKVHFSRHEISRKVVAFQELTSLKKNSKSARKASKLLEVPKSTMNSWLEQSEKSEKIEGLEAFLNTPKGAYFLQINIMAVMKLMKCGPSGIRGMQEYLQNSQLAPFVASSEGALQNFWVRCEEMILKFEKNEVEKLSQGMKHKKITVGLDEMFRGKRPCLVAIEVVSNYILLEKFTENRNAETWKKELENGLNGLNIEVVQVVSDLAGAIRSCTESIGAEHIPDLFHAQQEITKGTSAGLASQERAVEQSLLKKEEDLKKTEVKLRRLDKGKKKERKDLIVKTIDFKEQLKIELKEKSERRAKVKTANQDLSKIHHPIDLCSGKLQTADEMEKRFDEQFNIVKECAEDAGLSQSSISHIEKGERAFEKIIKWLRYFFIVYASFVTGLELGLKEREFFDNVIFPLTYLQIIWKRFKKEDREKHKVLLEELEAKMRDSSWPEELKSEWMQKAREIAERFQRSSSCVEGRNGVLSLNYHRFHRLNKRTLRVQSIVHNFDSRRSDKTTAAERLFGSKHENLFNFLVENVKIPGKPQKQKHKSKNRRQKTAA